MCLMFSQWQRGWFGSGLFAATAPVPRILHPRLDNDRQERCKKTTRRYNGLSLKPNRRRCPVCKGDCVAWCTCVRTCMCACAFVCLFVYVCVCWRVFADLPVLLGKGRAAEHVHEPVGNTVAYLGKLARCIALPRCVEPSQSGASSVAQPFLLAPTGQWDANRRPNMPRSETLNFVAALCSLLLLMHLLTGLR